MNVRDPRTVRWLSGIAFLFAAILLVARLGELPLLSPDEGRNAEVAREMRVSGAWLVPTYNGIPYLDKPCFYFRSVALSFALFGENEWAARLPSAFFALAVLALLFLFCRRTGRDHAPRAPGAELIPALTVAIVAASPLFMIFGRAVIFDMPLAFFVLLSVVAAFRAEPAGGGPVRAGRRRWWWALSAAAAGVATLIKGPVGFIVPGLVVAVHGLLAGAPIAEGLQPRRRIRTLGAMLSPLNLLVFFAVTLPWFLGLVHARPDFLQYGLVEETFRRYTTTAFHRTAPFYYYGPVVLGTFFPWSLLLPESIAAAWRARRRWVPADRLLIVAALVVVAFFSTSQSKLAGYVLAGVIALGALTARVFAHALVDREGAGARIVHRGNLTLAVVCPAVALPLILGITSPAWSQSSFGIRGDEFARLQPALLPLTITLLVLAALALLARRVRDPLLTLAIFASFSLSFLTVDFGALRSYAEASSSRGLARAIEAATRGGTPVAALEFFPTGLPFYLRRPVVLISRDGHEMTSNYLSYLLRETKSWPEGVVSYDQRASWLAARATPVFVLAGRRGRAELQKAAEERGAGVTEIQPGCWGALLVPVSAR